MSEGAENEGAAPVLAPAPGHEGDASLASDSAYSTIDLGTLWEMLSLGCVALSLMTRYITSWLYPPPQPPMVRLFLPIGFVATFASLGIVFGWIGSKRSRRPGLARFGVFLNSVVLALAGLLTLILFRIFPN